MEKTEARSRLSRLGLKTLKCNLERTDKGQTFSILETVKNVAFEPLQQL